MDIRIECCDLCNAPLRQKHGALITCGHSRGGWGRRETTIEWSAEICPKCYEEYQKITGAIAVWLDKRTGSRAPTIIVHEHDVSVVQKDEPPSRGREAPILR